jgi:anti-anti-sigma regulatory factor
VIGLFGELDLATTSVVEFIFSTTNPHDPVILDFAGLNFVDWAGLRSVLGLKEGMRPGSLFIRNPPPRIRNILQIVELSRFVEGV